MSTRAARERIYIVPRAAGFLLAAAILLALGAGYAFDGVALESRALGLSLFALGLVVLIQTNGNLRGVDVVSCRVATVAEGDPAELVVLLANASPEAHAGLSVRALPRRHHPHTAFIPSLEAGARLAVALPCPPRRRGVHPLPALRVSTVRPAGLCYAWKTFQPSGQAIVIPRPEGEPLRQFLDRRPGGGDLSEVRLGRPGDPPSRTDWKVLARTGRWMVRESDNRDREPVALRWADTAHLADTESRLRQLSRWVHDAHREGHPFTVDLGNGAKPASSYAGACRQLAEYPHT